MQTKISPPELEELEIFSLLTKVPHCLDIVQGPWGGILLHGFPAVSQGVTHFPNF